MNLKINNYNKGIISERIAIILLKLKGYKILKHRYKNKLGEIDIIALKKNCIICVEVKQRKYREDFLDAVSKKQIHRIRRSCELFATNPKYHNFNIRFDVIFFSPPFYHSHIKNAF